MLLDIGGYAPVVGEVLEVINGIWYLAEGDYRNAVMSGFSSVPFVGKGYKYGKLGVKIGDKVKINPRKLPGEEKSEKAKNVSKMMRGT